MLDLFSKATDAGAMLWASLDERERVLVLAAGVWLVGLFVASAYRQERRRRDDELLELFRLELDALPERKGPRGASA